MGSYITPTGFRKLEEEAEHLWTVERPRVTQEVSEAAALGDRSENAEYIYGKKRLREIDGRLRFLSKRMDALTVVRTVPERLDKVYFGARVRYEDEDGSEHEVCLVGPDESEPGAGRVSIESPIGRALMGKEEGDEVTIRRPRGNAQLTILGIDYDLLRAEVASRPGARDR